MWRALHEESKHQLQMVLLDVVASHKGNLNEQILPMFPQSIPFEQQTVGKEMEPPNEILIPRTPVKKWEDTGEVEYPEEMGEEYFDDPTGADSRAPHSPQEEPTWMPPGQQPVPFPFMGDSDREEEYADYGDEEEGDSKYADSGGPRSVSYSSFSTGDNKFKKGVPFTSAHYKSMVEFYREAGPTLRAADWVTFWNRVSDELAGELEGVNADNSCLMGPILRSLRLITG